MVVTRLSQANGQLQETLFSAVGPLTPNVSGAEGRGWIQHWKIGNVSKVGSSRKWLSLVAFVGIVAVIDYMLLDYLTSHGLEPKMQVVHIGGLQFSFPIVGLTFVGVLVVAVSAWLYMVSTMPVSALREMAPLETVRILRAAAIGLFFFTTLLFGPYILGSNVLEGGLSSVSRTIPQLAGGLQDMLAFFQPAMTLEALTKLAVSQNIAAAALVAVAGTIGRSQRRIRRTR